MQVLSVDFNAENAHELFTKSLRETGFAVIRNHPIQHQLIEEVYKDWKSFFSDSRKFDYLFDEETQDGYFPRDISEKAKGYDVKDIKEFFSVFPWGKYPDFISPSTKQLANELTDLACTLLQWIEDNTPPEIKAQLSQPLTSMIKDSPRTLLRVIHYPPLAGNEEEGAVRAAAHEDINLITLLPTATGQGLEVQGSDGEWRPIPCDFNSISVNIGDMLQMCTNGYYPSTTHRVCNPVGELAKASRFSMPLFLQPLDEVRLSDEYTAKEYLYERFRELGVVTS